MKLDDCGDLLTLGEVCALLGITEVQFYHLQEYGIVLVKPVMEERYHRFAKADVAAFVDP